MPVLARVQFIILPSWFLEKKTKISKQEMEENVKIPCPKITQPISVKTDWSKILFKVMKSCSPFISAQTTL